MIKKNKKVMSKGNRRKENIIKKMMSIYYSEKVQCEIWSCNTSNPSYETSKQVIMSTNIIWKYNKIKRCPMIK